MLLKGKFYVSEMEKIDEEIGAHCVVSALAISFCYCIYNFSPLKKP
jgi:hypothetical protein